MENYEQKGKDITIRYDNDLTFLSPLFSHLPSTSLNLFFFFACFLTAGKHITPKVVQHEATCPRVQSETIRTGMREIYI